MKSQSIIVAAICLTYVAYALPVPDEEVSLAQTTPASEVNFDIAKKPEVKPIEPDNSSQSVETRAVKESKSIGKPGSHPSVIDVSSAFVEADIKLDAPDAQTLFVITEKKAIVEEKDFITSAATATDTEKKNATFVTIPELKKDQNTLDEKKIENKSAARTETEGYIEASKNVSLVEALAANVEVQKKVVDESKASAYLELKAPVGKSTELPKESAATTNKVEEKKSVREDDANLKTEKAPAKKLAAGEEIKESTTGERVIELKLNKSNKEKATSISPLVTLESVALADPATADISPVIVQSAQEEKKFIAEEKLPAEEERFNEHEKDISSANSASNVATETTTTNQSKSEVIVQAIPSSKNTIDGQLKPAKANEQTVAELNRGASDGNMQIKVNAVENKPENEDEDVAAIVKITSEPEPNKNASVTVKTAQENKVENDTMKTITETEQQQLKNTDDKKISSEEKYSSEKKSGESNDSSETKESDESDNSKENKFN